MQLGNGGSTGSLGTGNIDNAGTIVVNRSTDLIVPNVINGSGNLIKMGSNTLTMSANSSYSSSTTITDGVLILSNDAPTISTSSFIGPGRLRIEPSSSSFSNAFSTGGLVFGSSLSGLTIGKPANVSQITHGSPISIAGDVSFFGGTIAINEPLTASNAAVKLTAATAVTQTAPIVARDLVLQGAGAFTLTNLSNNIGSINGGDLTRLGDLSFTDGTGGLAINAIVSAGTIRVETLEGDIALTQNLATTSTSTDAIIVNAGLTTPVGTITGGNISVSGSPSITMGIGGIAKLYSGSESASTGLTTLAGGLANTRFSADESTTTFSPVLAAGNSYAIYRSTVSASPTNVVVTAGNAQISVAFTTGADGGGSITNYEYTTNGGTTWIAATPLITSSPLVITGLLTTLLMLFKFVQ